MPLNRTDRNFNSHRVNRTGFVRDVFIQGRPFRGELILSGIYAIKPSKITFKSSIETGLAK